MNKPDELPLSAKSHILNLAQKHGVSYAETATDRLGNLITRLSGDEVTLDDVELLLIAMSRAGVLTKSEMFALFKDYLEEKRQS